MAQISLTIPDAQLTRVIDAVAAVHGWTQGSGLTKPQFAKQVLRDILASTVQSYEGEQAGAAARVAAEQKARSEISIS